MKNIWQSFQKPKKLEKFNISDTYGKFVIEPFERGFGVTVGNSLRRFLLSSIEGCAVNGIRMDNVYHEFSTIPGIVEDVADIILNIKEVRFKMHDNNPQVVTLHMNKKGEITAKDIETNDKVTVLTKDHHIATVDKDNLNLKLELLLTKGRGYVPADKNAEAFQGDPQVIPIDSIFSPVKKVNYNIENTRVGQITDYDKLVLEVWTDGSINPEDAIAHAASILKEHTQIFINFEEEIEPEEPKIDMKRAKMIDNLKKSVEELELSVRSSNCLMNADIKTLAELVQKTDSEMLKTRNFGRKSLNEIKEVLTEMGLGLGLKLKDLGLTSEERELLGIKDEAQ